MLPEQHAVSLARQKLKIPRLPVLTVLLYPTDHSPPVPLRIKNSMRLYSFFTAPAPTYWP
jgi:hypothetical protein